eukprot:TRINITY_DN9261_c0_g1_i5.p1 TRINITY_DN9261_c0_g1~~TRINITY_DN9261_c0_g1_i5.p1  ORF type:complete len:613 (+),score=132.32 TRINITY_DN9261_c0_g1_i5:54-1892(+)
MSRPLRKINIARGRIVEPTVLEYLRGVRDLLTQSESLQSEDQSLMLENVAKELKTLDPEVIRDAHCSKILEVIIPRLSAAQLASFLYGYLGRYEELTTDCCASHVIEVAFSGIPEALQLQGSIATDANPDQNLEQVFLEICQVFATNIVDMMQQSYSSHVLRTMFGVLSGYLIRPAPKGKKATESIKELSVPKVFKKKFKKIVKGMLSNPEISLSQLALHQQGSPVLQIVIRCLSGAKIKKAQSYADKIFSAAFKLKEAPNQNQQYRILDLGLKDNVGSHFIECALQYISDPLYFETYTEYFRGKLLDYSKDQRANYVIQALIAHIRDQPQAQLLAEELVDSIPYLTKNERTGIVLKLADCCLKFNVCQKQFFKKIQEFCQSQKSGESELNIVSILLSVGKSQNPRQKYSPFGSALIQQMLLFEESSKQILINHFSSLSVEDYKAMATDSTASRCLEAYIINQPTARGKQNLFKAFKGNLVELICLPSSSFVLEKFFTVIDENRRHQMMDELAPHVKQITSSFHGKIVASRIKLETYAEGKEEWKEVEKQNQKKLEMFADIIGDSKPAPKPKKTPKLGKDVVPLLGEAMKDTDSEKSETIDENTFVSIDTVY